MSLDQICYTNSNISQADASRQPPILNKTIEQSLTDAINTKKIHQKRKFKDAEMKNSNKTQKVDIPLQNRFSALSNHEHSSSEDLDDDNAMDTQTTKLKKKTTIPIIVDISAIDINYTKLLMKKVREKLPEVNMKYTPKTLTFFTTAEVDHKTISEFLDKYKIQNHTFSRKNEGDQKFVIKGLPLDIKDIVEDLNSHGITPKKIALMKRSKDTRAKNEKDEEEATYDMAAPHDTDTSTIFKIRFICGVKIKWEKYKNPKRVTQCYNCQTFGHGTTNCHNKPRCIKYAGKHAAKDCKLDKDDKLKCTNCKGEHPANFSKCPSYLSHLETIDQRRQISTISPKPKKPPAPAYSIQNFPSLSTEQQKHQHAETSKNNNNHQRKTVILFLPTIIL